MRDVFTLADQKKSDAIREKVLTLCKGAIKKCPKCGGTGLSGISKNPAGGGFSWTGGFCDNCKGSGYIDWENSGLIFICENCDGTGKDKNWSACKSCGGEGTLDWVQHIKGTI